MFTQDLEMSAKKMSPDKTPGKPPISTASGSLIKSIGILESTTPTKRPIKKELTNFNDMRENLKENLEIGNHVKIQFTYNENKFKTSKDYKCRLRSDESSFWGSFKPFHSM